MALKLQTEIKLSPSSLLIEPSSSIFLCGSCFTLNIGEMFAHQGFSTQFNPFGVLFNPFSIASCLSDIANKRTFTEADFFESNELWYSYDLHGKLAYAELLQSIENANRVSIEQHDFLKKANFAFLTFGTAFVFELIEPSKIVANCHKQANQLFKRRLLSIEEISSAIKQSIDMLHKINPTIQIILTVSPVRHWRDGAFQNQVSKSHLFAAIYPFIENKQTLYFPSYELVMDELRDYRFYDRDLLHINNLAIEYIWEKLQFVYFSNQAKEFAEAVLKIQKNINHKVFDEKSKAYLRLIQTSKEKVEELENKFNVNLLPLKQQLNDKL
jgi:hypothetical protein